MVNVRQVAKYFGIVNAGLGALGLFGPAVTGNRDGLINVHPGRLLDVFAINWLHALLHLGVGVFGFPASRSGSSAASYMRLNAALFGLLATAGFWKGRERAGIYMVMGMAINQADNLVHAAWAAIGLIFAARPNLVARVRR